MEHSNRRAFLRLVGLSAAGLAAGAFDPDMLTWRPGARVYSLPPVQVFGSIRDVRGQYVDQAFMELAHEAMRQFARTQRLVIYTNSQR
jgi:hypothetical protein